MKQVFGDHYNVSGMIFLSILSKWQQVLESFNHMTFLTSGPQLGNAFHWFLACSISDYIKFVFYKDIHVCIMAIPHRKWSYVLK